MVDGGEGAVVVEAEDALAEVDLVAVEAVAPQV